MPFILAASLFEECSFTADCKIGLKPACVNIGTKNYCIEQCSEGEDLYQCGIGRKCEKSLDIDGTNINSCAVEINCSPITNQCIRSGEICSPYSFTCVPALLLPTTTTYKTVTSGNIFQCTDKGFFNNTYSCSVISDLCSIPKYKKFMEEYCSRTCGFCKSENINLNVSSCNDTFEIKLRKELTAIIRLPQNF
uniref:ShKT domain-containing protein n=1 Tax=Strongyloides venezuelensis TaxID=75913 RepID=A0A0K0FTL0_STRVS